MEEVLNREIYNDQMIKILIYEQDQNIFPILLLIDKCKCCI